MHLIKYFIMSKVEFSTIPLTVTLIISDLLYPSSIFIICILDMLYLSSKLIFSIVRFLSCLWGGGFGFVLFLYFGVLCKIFF